LNIVGDDFFKSDDLNNSNSIILKFLKWIKQYNDIQLNLENKIVLAPGFFASKLGR